MRPAPQWHGQRRTQASTAFSVHARSGPAGLEGRRPRRSNAHSAHTAARQPAGSRFTIMPVPAGKNHPFGPPLGKGPGASPSTCLRFSGRPRSGHAARRRPQGGACVAGGVPAGPLPKKRLSSNSRSRSPKFELVCARQNRLPWLAPLAFAMDATHRPVRPPVDRWRLLPTTTCSSNNRHLKSLRHRKNSLLDDFVQRKPWQSTAARATFNEKRSLRKRLDARRRASNSSEKAPNEVLKGTSSPVGRH